MVQSYGSLHVHLIFGTKGRRPFLSDDVRNPLHAYIGKVLSNLKCRPEKINSVEDHIHLLFNLARTISVADAIKEVKTSSSQWIKGQGPGLAKFAWQTGYAIFSVSESNVATVERYITRQREHHRKMSFQDEIRELMRRHRIEFDEQYGWD